MESILMQQQLSFDNKLMNIHQTNNLLDQLEMKMKNYFKDPIPTNFSNPPQDQLHVQFKQKMSHKNQIGRTTLQQGTNFNNPNIEDFEFESKERQRNQFKFYDKFNQNQQISTVSRNKERRPVSSFLQEQDNQSKGRGESFPSSKVNEEREKKNSNEFRLIKSKSKQIKKAKVQQNNGFINPSEKGRQQVDQVISQKATLNKKYPTFNQNSYLHEQPNTQQENLPNIANTMSHQIKNQLIFDMENMEQLMQQKLNLKNRRLKQIQQQILTQNQQRVYLYKVNVRLSEQLKFIQQQNNHHQQQVQANINKDINKLQDHINNLKIELTKKKNQKKQLNKEEQTLREGYQTILQANKSMLKKQLDKHPNQNQSSKQNEFMLKNLIKQLDKLKVVVESKIKSNHGGLSKKHK